MLSRMISAQRISASWLRSFVYRNYLKVAYPGISCHHSVRFGRGVTIKCFDGGSLSIGAGSAIDDNAIVIVERGNLLIGCNCLITFGCVVVCTQRIEIGDGTLIAEYVTIRDQDHRHDDPQGLDAGGLMSSPIKIGNDVWIGAKATITRGVEIAAHSVIGANSVVTRSLLKRGVYSGAPARLHASPSD